MKATLRNDPPRWVMALLLAAFSLLVILVHTGCYTTGKAEKKLYKAKAKQPVTTAQWVIGNYHITTGTKDSVIYLQGETQVFTDTVEADCDTVFSQVPGAARIVRIPCPPSTARVDTVFKTRETIKEDKSKDVLLSDMQDQRDEERNKATLFMWWAIIASGLLLVMIILKMVSKRIGI